MTFSDVCWRKMPGCSYPDWALCELSQAEPSFTAKTSPELAAGLAGWTGQMCAEGNGCPASTPQLALEVFLFL